MHCQQFEEMLEQQPDGPLPLGAADHLNACPRCRLLREDLEAIGMAGHAWGRDDSAPPPHVWASIHAQLQAEGLIAEPAPGWFAGGWGPAPRLALAGAYLSLLLIASGLAGYRPGLPSNSLDRSNAEVQTSGPSLAGLGQALDGNMQRVVASFSERDGSLARSLRQNLGIVDNLIAVCEKSVREHPGDPLAREYLYGAYQQKADLLAVAIDRTTLENK